MKSLTFLSLFLLTATTCYGRILKPINKVKDLQSFGINIENTERKGDVVKFEVVSPSRVTFKAHDGEISNSFSSVALVHSLGEFEPAWAKEGMKGTKLHLRGTKEKTGKFRSEVQITKENWKNLMVVVQFAEDEGGNPILIYFSLIELFEQVEESERGGS